MTLISLLKIGKTKIFVITPNKLTFVKEFKHIGNITRFVAILIASEDARNFGNFNFVRYLVNFGAIDIIAKTHKNDN